MSELERRLKWKRKKGKARKRPNTYESLRLNLEMDGKKREATRGK